VITEKVETADLVRMIGMACMADMFVHIGKAGMFDRVCIVVIIGKSDLSKVTLIVDTADKADKAEGDLP
jgi:hypothetical protein